MTSLGKTQLDSHEITETRDGIAVVERYKVTMAGPTPTSKRTDPRMYRLLQAGDVPKRGDPHPDIPDLFLIERRVQPIDPSLVELTLRYGVPTADDPIFVGVSRIRVGSGASSENTATDINGRPIRTVLFRDVFQDQVQDVQDHNVDVERPASQAVFERLEKQNPLATSIAYTGTINATLWYGGAPGTWLCSSIEGDSDDGGKTYRVSYVFQFKAEGWNPIIRHRDPDTGLPVGDDPFQRRAVIQPVLYPRRNFGRLRL